MLPPSAALPYTYTPSLHPASTGARIYLPPNLYVSLAFTLAAGLVAAAIALSQARA